MCDGQSLSPMPSTSLLNNSCHKFSSPHMFFLVEASL